VSDLRKIVLVLVLDDFASLIASESEGFMDGPSPSALNIKANRLFSVIYTYGWKFLAESA